MQPVDPRQMSTGFFSTPQAYNTNASQPSVITPTFGYSMTPTKMAVMPSAQSNSFGNILNTIKEVVSMVLKVVEMVYSLFGGTTQNKSSMEGGVLSSNGAMLAGEAQEKKGGGFLDKIIPYASKAVSFIKDIFSPEEKVADAATTSTTEATKEAAGGGFFDSIKSFGSSIGGGIKSVGSSIWDGIKGIGSFIGSLF